MQTSGSCNNADLLSEIRYIPEDEIIDQLGRRPAADLSGIRWPTEAEILAQLEQQSEKSSDTP